MASPVAAKQEEELPPPPASEKGDDETPKRVIHTQPFNDRSEKPPALETTPVDDPSSVSAAFVFVVASDAAVRKPGETDSPRAHPSKNPSGKSSPARSDFDHCEDPIVSEAAAKPERAAKPGLFPEKPPEIQKAPVEEAAASWNPLRRWGWM